MTIHSHSTQLLLLVDAGGTHTRALVTTLCGVKAGESRGGPSNAFVAGEAEALANLTRTVRRALACCHARRAQIEAAVIGSAGVDHRDGRDDSIQKALRAQFGWARVLVVEDALIALEGALLGRPGVVVASGTGSMVCGKTARGRIVRVGGWGPLFGDEGSAQWIGRHALQAAARAADGTGPKTMLLSIFNRVFGLGSFDGIIGAIYGRTMSPAKLGSLAPLVSQAAQRGDACALEIFERAGKELATQAAAAIRRLNLQRPTVSYQGSTFRSGRLLLDPLERNLKHHVPDVSLAPPLLPPLGGAFLLALRELGIKPADPLLVTFRKYNCG